MRGPNLFNQTFNFKLKKKEAVALCFFCLMRQPFFGVPTKKRRAARWDGPYKCGPWDHEPLATTYRKKTTVSMMNNGMRMATDQPM